MSHPLSIDPSEIALLDSHRFTLFCNDLLRAEAARCGIPQACVDTTVHETDPDSGIDARITPPAPFSQPPGEAWLPLGQSVWQFKSGDCPSANVLARDEFSKPGVRTAISSGASYRFLTADSISNQKRDEIEEQLKELGLQLGVTIVGPSVLTATHLAKWAEQHLPVAQVYFKLPIDGIEPFEAWERHPRFRNAFFPDRARTELLEAIRQRLQSGEQRLRLAGQAGDGKTRLVLEAVRIDGFRERVLYAADASQVSPAFLRHLLQYTPSGSAILIIDGSPRLGVGRREAVSG